MIFNPSELVRANIYLTKLFERGKSVKIEPILKARTLSQTAYCWLVFTHVGFETGNDKNDIYQFCLTKFPQFKSIQINGSHEVIPVTLSGMDKEQTSAFIDSFVVFFRQEGIEVPDPEDLKCRDMMDYYRTKGLI